MFNYSTRNKNDLFLIAEMSGNHNNSLSRAKEIIDAAKESDADAVKIQTYTADTLTLNVDNEHFRVPDIKGQKLWAKKRLYDLFKEAHTPWEWHQELFDYAKKKDILLFSTPFDRSAVNFLENLNNPIYKISSYELIDPYLVRYIAEKKKPVIFSTGIATLDEIGSVIALCKKEGVKDLTMLHCISSYPAAYNEMNLGAIEKLKSLFGIEVGLSDHSLGPEASISAVALGARVIEKHFTLSRDDGGVDSAFSLTPSEFKSMAMMCKNTVSAMGKIPLRTNENDEGERRKTSRSVFVSEDIKAGETLTELNIKTVRPGMGLHPKWYESALGRRARKDLKKGTPLDFYLFE